MMDFGESVVFTSNTNGKRVRIRKDFIDVIFEVGSSTIDGKFIAPTTQITTRTNVVYIVKETYDQVEELLGRNL